MLFRSTAIDIEALAHSVGIERVLVVDPYDIAATREAIKAEQQELSNNAEIYRRYCAMSSLLPTLPPEDAEKFRATLEEMQDQLSGK